ncbi:MAG: hypothetical protein WCG31_02600 [Deltaproteobacteria bacterium]|jgi:hypothetical protein
MWFTNQRGEEEFTGGQDDWAGAARLASTCPYFNPDVEEEFVADDPVSCYNCRYRRWSTGSFTCLKKDKA